MDFKEYNEYKKNWKPTSEVILAKIVSEGRLIGFSQVVHHAYIQKMAFQHMTYISPQHRRKGLSSEMKTMIYNYLIINKDWAENTLIITNNHFKNIPMLAVNKIIGFKRVAFYCTWMYNSI